MIIKILKEDITKLNKSIDCIVNAANESLLGGGGVDGAIHFTAGPNLLKECRTLHGCRPGEAKATKAYNLPQKYIIHTVGPRYYENPNPKETLRKCYLNSLKLADKLGCKAIAFPSISTGVFAYPVKEAAKICAETVSSFKPKSLEIAYMCILPFQEDVIKAYKAAFSNIKSIA